MASLGDLFYNLHIQDFTQAEISAVNSRLSQLGTNIRLDPALFKSAIDEAVKNPVTVKVTPNITSKEVEDTINKGVISANITPVLPNLTSQISAAFTAAAPDVSRLFDPAAISAAIRNAFTSMDFTAVGTSLGATLEKTIKAKVEGVLYTVNIKIDETKLANHIKNAMKEAEKRELDLKVSKNLKKTIEDAINDNLKINFKAAPLVQSISAELNRNPFTIQIKVLKDQARQAVQTAIGNASNITNAEALKYQRLMRGEASAARAELDKVRAAHIGAADAARTHASASSSVGSAMRGNIGIANELTNTFAGLYSIQTAKQFLSNIIEIGGELEHQKIALETIYGSESKMEGLYSQIKGLARQSPFGVMDLTKNIKQLSAYGVAYNEVYDTAKRLADISAATSVDINRLILAFGKTKNRTFLDGLEAKQFAYANIPIYDALSKKLTELEGKFVSVKDVMGRIKKREIGFDMVKDILWNMTDEGGKFYNMQEKLAGSVKTSWKLVRDNIELMFGEIAESEVGSMLKDLGEILQGATRNWKALFTVVSAGTATFGVYKLAVFGLNKHIDAQTASTLKNALAEKQKQAAQLSSIGLTQTLSDKEKQLIATRKMLTAADIEALHASGAISSAEIQRAYISGLVTKETMKQLLAMGLLTKAEYDQVVGTTLLSDTWKKLKFSMSGAFAGMKTGAAAAFGMIFNWTTAIIAAISGLTYLVQHNLQEDKIAEDFSNAWKKKGEDMAKSISESLKKPFEDLSAPQASQLIEEYKNLIKDFASLPDDVIQRAIYDKDGNIRDTADQIKYLREELESLKQTAESMNDDSGVIISATGDGWFTEDIITNLKDWSSSYKDANAIYTKFVTQHKEDAQKMVDAARQADAAYAMEIKGAKNLIEEFTILMRNRSKFIDGYKAAESEVGKMAIRGGGWGFSAMWTTTPFEAMRSELWDLNKAVEQVRESFRMLMQQHDDWDWDNLTESQSEYVRQFFNKLLEQAEITSPELKKILADVGSEIIPIKLIPDEIEEAWIKNAGEVAAKCADNATNEALRILKLEGWDSLDETQKNLIKQLFKTADEETKKELPGLLGEVQSWLDAHTPIWRIGLVVNKQLDKDLSQAAKDAMSNVGGASELSATTTDLLTEWDKDDATAESIRKAAKEYYDATKKEFEEAKKFGESSKTYLDAKEKYENAKQTLTELKWQDLMKSRTKGDGSKGSKKDTVAEQFKQRFKDLKDAWSEYQKWQKSIGDEAAAQRIADSGLFGDMSAEDIPRTAEQFKAAVEKLKRELESAGVEGHSQREALLNEYIKQILDIDKSMVDEKINSALESVERSFERQMEDFNLFKKIRKSTGNEDLAFAFSFGLDGGNKDYIKMVKEQFNELSRKAKEAAPDIEILDFDKIDEDNVVKLPEALQKAWRDAVKNIANYKKEQRDVVADALSEHRNAMEEIVALQAEAAEKIQKIRESMESGDLSRVKNGNIIGQDLINDIKVNLDFEIFKRSGEYLKFFNASLALTADVAEEVGTKIKENLDKKLQKGLISAKEYCDEMEKINKILKEIKSKQSDFGDFMKGGLSNMFEQDYKNAEAKRNAAATDYSNAAQKFKIAQEAGNEAGMQLAQNAMSAASSMGEAASGAMGAAQGGMDTIATIDTIVHAINDTVQGIKGAFDLIRDMADSFGADTGADTDWGAAGAFLDAFSQASQYATDAWDSLKSGNVGGVIQGVVGSITSWFTVFNRWHDEKLQAQIEKSKEVVQNIQYAYDAIERRLDRFLGNRRNLSILDVEKDKRSLNEIDARIAETKNRIEKGNYHALGVKALEGRLNLLNHQREDVNKRVQAYETGGALGYQRQLMTEQLAELEKQKSLEEAKKKSDSAAISDYADQIDEMRVQILQFAEEMASETYGIDLNDWAEQIGDSLVDAFARGEDAAEAFDNTVSDILRSLVGKMISQDIIAPMFDDLKNYLFGEYGNTGAYGEDFQLDASEVAAMKTYLDKIRDEGIPAAENLFNAINEATGGILSDTESASNSVSAGIQSVTEDTASLLASYINAIRAYCAENSLNFDQLMKDCMPRLTAIAEAQLTQLNMIAENTRRNMMAAEAIQQSNQNIADLFRAATKSKDHGLYIR